MPNVATILKEEIRRQAKKVVKIEVSATRRAVAQYRRDIARLKREVREQARALGFLKGQERKRLGLPETEEEKIRHSARSVCAQRRRLKLSAEQFATLVGVSSQSVYHWEHGAARPRKAQLRSLARVRKLGRREALAELAPRRRKPR